MEAAQNNLFNEVNWVEPQATRMALEAIYENTQLFIDSSYLITNWVRTHRQQNQRYQTALKKFIKFVKRAVRKTRDVYSRVRKVEKNIRYRGIWKIRMKKLFKLSNAMARKSKKEFEKLLIQDQKQQIMTVIHQHSNKMYSGVWTMLHVFAYVAGIKEATSHQQTKYFPRALKRALLKINPTYPSASVRTLPTFQRQRFLHHMSFLQQLQFMNARKEATDTQINETAQILIQIIQQSETTLQHFAEQEEYQNQTIDEVLQVPPPPPQHPNPTIIALYNAMMEVKQHIVEE